ncbi:MAG: membrane protein insertion efficiency factor YidD [Calditerrivibrio sp.]|nr:membrane protein insertion efficiency factor YidD [Calditerrivibrio sp.]
MLEKVLKRFVIAVIKIYKYIISPYLGNNCRFYPSCSVYAIEAIEKKGVFRGVLLSIWRILRCNPFNRGGVDYVK